MDYSRNWLFIEPATQARLAELRVLVIGLGIGSVFAELAVRTGVLKLMIADGDRVEASNLNRQNYTQAEVGQLKALGTASRLRAINPGLELIVLPHYLDGRLMEEAIAQSDLVINTIDFDAPAFADCTRFCRAHSKTELFPINLGFGAVLTMLDRSCPEWSEVFPMEGTSSLKERILRGVLASPGISPYLAAAGQRYFSAETLKPGYDPQLAVSTHLVAALMVTALVQWASGAAPAKFPLFHYLDASGSGLLKPHG